MPQPILANVFLQPSRSIIVHTTPGRSVSFRGGHARVDDHRDMPHMLAREDARVIPTEWACSWAYQWLSQTRELKATVEWPEGWRVEFTNKDEFVIDRPDGSVVAAQPVAPVEILPDDPPFADGKKLMDVLLGEPESKPAPAPKRRTRKRAA